MNEDNVNKIFEVANEKVFNGVPKFKLEYFVAGSNPTPFHKMKQYLMELKIKQSSFLHSEHLVEKKKLEIEIAQRKYETEEDHLQKQDYKLDLLAFRRDLKILEENLNGALKEKDWLLGLIDTMDKSPEGKLPDGTRLLDVFGNEEKEDQLEREYWINRLAKQASTDLLAYGRIQTGNIDAIAMLPSDMQKKTLQLASDHTARYDVFMKEISQKTINDMRIGYIDPETKRRLDEIKMPVGVTEEDYTKKLLQSDNVNENNTVINNKYKEE